MGRKCSLESGVFWTVTLQAAAHMCMHACHWMRETHGTSAAEMQAHVYA